MPLDSQNNIDAEKILIAASSTVVKDRVDLRDLLYLPTLRPLSRSLPVPPHLRERPELVRNQFTNVPGEAQGTCTAHALAAVVDLLRAGEREGAPPRVAAQMLYRHGRELEMQETGAAEEGLRSLRSAIKGFYHNGVCLESSWVKDPEEEQRGQVNIFKQAREIPLGSYYRLQPILNDYHAALNEVGVIYGAAEIHGGWAPALVKANAGVIKLDSETEGLLQGNHAFAIVGYSPLGFYVLNSWGSEWGGYNPEPDNPESKPIPGVALWSYQDWAERIIDGWVLRLGVSAPDAFRFSFGRQGLGDFAAGEITAGSTPRHELLGHYIHIDDGKFVTEGAIPCSLNSIAATCELISDKRMPSGNKEKDAKRYQKILLWLPGGAEGTKDILRHIASTKDYWKQRGVYPITGLWCSDLLDHASDLLGRLGEGAFELVGQEGADLDRRMEFDSRSIGRAVWRDVKRSAAAAAASDLMGDKDSAGAMLQALKQITDIVADIEIHIVAEGAGAILARELLGQLGREATYRIKSLSLILPACTLSDFEELRRWNARGDSPLHVFVTDEATRRRFKFGRYGGSLLDLAQMAFVEEPPRRKRPSAGAPRSRKPVIGKKAPDSSQFAGLLSQAELQRRFPDVKIGEIKLPPSASPITTLRAVSAGKDALNEVYQVLFRKKPEVAPPEYMQSRGITRGLDVRPATQMPAAARAAGAASAA